MELYKRNNNEDTPKTIYGKIDDYIKNKYIILFNEISLCYEISLLEKKDETFQLNECSLLIELYEGGITTNNQTLKNYLRSDMVERYNPIKHYFNSLPKHDNKNHIKKLCTYINTDDNHSFEYHLEKWMVRAILSIFFTDKINKHCIVLSGGEQHIGKSTFCNFLIPDQLKKYSSENLSIDKDSRIKLCKTFIINLEELDVMGRSDVNSLKSFLSQTWVNERLPYAERSETIPRICSFISSTNRTEFLNDDTGSVRWIVFEVIGKIDFRYSKEIDIDKVWAEAFHLAFSDRKFNSELTREDVIASEKRNERFTILSLEREFVSTYCRPGINIDDFRTATNVVNELKEVNQKLNIQKMGSALSRAKYQRIKHPQRQEYGYLVKIININKEKNTK